VSRSGVEEEALFPREGDERGGEEEGLGEIVPPA